MADKWVLRECSNGRKTCDNSNKSSEDIFEVIKLLEKQFSVYYDDKGGAGLDGVYFSARINGEPITIGWDIWSGLFIMSMNESGNSIIESVFEYLNMFDE